MAKEAEKTEEKVEDKTEQQDQSVHQSTDEVTEDVKKSMTDFDAKIDADDTDTGDDDTDDEKAKGDDDDSTDGKADDKTADDDDSGKDKKADEQTAEDKEIEAEAKAIEEAAKVEAGKSDEQKQAEKLASEQIAKNEADAKVKSKEAEKYVSDLDPEEWDDDAIAADTAKGQKHLDETKALQDQNAELQNRLAQQDNQRNVEFLDRKIAALGEDFHEALGVGDWEDLDPASEQDENRAKIGPRMAVIAQAHINKGLKVPSRGKLFDRAVKDVFKTIVDKPKKDADTAKKLKDRKGQVLGDNKGKASAQTATETCSQKLRDFDKKLDE
jgi:hypothetical protein